MSGAVPSGNPTGYLGLSERNPPDIITTSRDPLTTDYKNYKLGDFWFNKVSHKFWILVNLANNSAIWDPFAGPTAGLVDFLTGDTGGPVTGDSNGNINILGTAGQISVTGNPATNTLTLGLAGGGTAIDSIAVNASTAPGTNPVTPNGSGQISMTGAQVATGTIGANVIRTDSLAANTLTVEIQRSTAVAATDSTKNGVAHFSSGQFAVDASGFVTLLGGTEAVDSFEPDTGTSPVVPTAAGLVAVKGQATPNVSGIQVTGATNALNIAMFSPFSGGFTFTDATSGATETLTVTNTSNTASSQAQIVASVAGTSAGDAWNQWSIGSTNSYALGPDNSDSDILKLTYAASGSISPSSGATFLQAETSGNITVPTGDLIVSRAQASGGPQINLTNTSAGANGSARYTVATDSNTGDLYTLYDAPGGSPNSFEVGYQASTLGWVVQINPTNASPNMDGATALSVANSGLVSVTANDLNVTRATSLPEVFVTQTGGTDFARFRALGTSPKTGYFSSGISTPLYWNFGMASTLSNAYCLNTSNASVAPEGGTIVWKANTTGEITMPLQPAFFAYLAATATNKTGNGASYTLGTDALTEVYDQGSDFNTNGTFTAPVTGIYDLRAQITLTGTTIATSFVISIVTTGRTYISTFTRAALSTDQTVAISALAQMTAADTATVTIVASGEAADTDDILGAATAQSFFCGQLAC